MRSEFQREILGCVQYMPYVFKTAAVTTSFDDVLKTVLRECSRHPSPKQSWRPCARIAAYHGCRNQGFG